MQVSSTFAVPGLNLLDKEKFKEDQLRIRNEMIDRQFSFSYSNGSEAELIKVHSFESPLLPKQQADKKLANNDNLDVKVVMSAGSESSLQNDIAKKTKKKQVSAKHIKVVAKQNNDDII